MIALRPPPRTPGEAAYAEDVRRAPTYSPGRPRPGWDDLDPLARAAWERRPTPRPARLGG